MDTQARAKTSYYENEDKAIIIIKQNCVSWNTVIWMIKFMSKKKTW